jgi:hypothetical protein
MIITTTLLLSVLLILSEASTTLFKRYQDQVKPQMKDAHYLFAVDLFTSLHRRVPSIDSILGDQKTSILAEVRRAFTENCGDIDPLIRFQVTHDEFTAIVTSAPSDDSLPIKLYSLFKELECMKDVPLPAATTITRLYRLDTPNNVRLQSEQQLYDAMLSFAKDWRPVEKRVVCQSVKNWFLVDFVVELVRVRHKMHHSGDDSLTSPDSNFARLFCRVLQQDKLALLDRVNIIFEAVSLTES